MEFYLGEFQSSYFSLQFKVCNRYMFVNQKVWIIPFSASDCCFSGLFLCVMRLLQGSAGVLDSKGASKPPGKAGLCAVLLWLCCAHHPRSQSRGRHIQSPFRGEAVRPRWVEKKTICYVYCLSRLKKQ